MMNRSIGTLHASRTRPVDTRGHGDRTPSTHAQLSASPTRPARWSNPRVRTRCMMKAEYWHPSGALIVEPTRCLPPSNLLPELRPDLGSFGRQNRGSLSAPILAFKRERATGENASDAIFCNDFDPCARSDYGWTSDQAKAARPPRGRG